MIFDAGHGFGSDHGVDDGFFGGLDGGGENGIDFVVGQHLQVDHVVCSGSARIGGGEGDKNIAGAVAGNAAVAAESERNATSEAVKLVRNERSVCGNDNDDGTMVVVAERSPGVGIIGGNFPSDRNPGNAQIIFRAVVALHKNTNRVAAFFFAQLAGRGADAPFEAVANHSCAAADGAFFHSTAMRGVDGVERVLGFDVEAIDVVEPAVPGFRNNGE